MRNPAYQGGAFVALCLAVALTACQAGTPTAPLGPPRQNDETTPYLNPQPEPPSLQVRFALSPDGGDWFGHVFVGDESCGSIQLLSTGAETTGIVTHVGYALSITGANPAFQLDASLQGVIVQGRVVLNGMVSSGAYAGQTIHPRGTIQVAGGGTTDQLTTLAGAVQLNPQPEPPSMEYPPSPCSQ